MRVLILSIASFLCAQIVSGQKNNPFSQRGSDYVTSFNLIKKDYDAGNIKALNEKTIAYYSGKVPLKNELSLETASTVFKTIQSGKTSLSDVLKNAAVSETVKRMTREILFNPKNLNDEQFKDFLVQKNEEIKSAEVADNEKEILFTLSAIAYSIRNNQMVGYGRNNHNGCMVVSEEGSGSLSNSGCIGVSMAVGFYIGFHVCGAWCGLGGAIIAGVATAISLS
jgi:hypothetical protein